MGFLFHDLDSETRRHMSAEIERDIELGRLYLGRYLTDHGKAVYPKLIASAASEFDVDWLAAQIGASNMLVAAYPKNTPSGGTTMAKVGYNANEMLAEGEFNRFYIRGLCLRAPAEGCRLVVYRAKEVTNPRPTSEAKIGQIVDAAQLLEDIRNTVGIDTALGLPNGPNSGLCVRLEKLPAKAA